MLRARSKVRGLNRVWRMIQQLRLRYGSLAQGKQGVSVLSRSAACGVIWWGGSQTMVSSRGSGRTPFCGDFPR